MQYQHRGENGIQGPVGARVIMAGRAEQLLSDENCSPAELGLMGACQQNIADLPACFVGRFSNGVAEPVRDTATAPLSARL